jgi:hypothetical protein
MLAVARESIAWPQFSTLRPEVTRRLARGGRDQRVGGSWWMMIAGGALWLAQEPGPPPSTGAKPRNQSLCARAMVFVKTHPCWRVDADRILEHVRSARKKKKEK